MLGLLIAVIAVALIFDFTNGFHDSANAIGTSIATRALTPTAALILAAILNFVGALLSTSIADTIGKGIVEPAVCTLPIVLSGLVAAIIWNLLTWYFGIPSSSSHCLVGGIAGAVLMGYSAAGVKWGGIAMKVLLPTVASPILGFVAGWGLSLLVNRLSRNMLPGRANQRFRHLQLLSASAMALSHGLNDAQKTMGIITLALFASHTIPTVSVPTWVKFLCAVVMGLGTFAGGKKIIKTLGSKIVKLTTADGFSAQTSGAVVLQLAAHLGLPVSTTHAITATIMGAGAARNAKAVRWGVTRGILIAWVLTLPASGLLGAAIVLIVRAFTG
jgi:inorganic phosphate transporter, PiT family